MQSTFFGLDIAVSGMQTYQASLNTAAHNLANAGTKGYSRQVVNTTAATPLRGSATYGMLGTGVTVNDITRQRSDYYDTKYRISSTVDSEYDTKAYYLQCIEGYLYSSDMDVAGITTSFDNFCGALTGLTSDASDGTKRTEAITYAQTFTGAVQKIGQNLQELQSETNFEIKTTVDKINAIAEQVASLTKQINTVELYGGTANDLRDQRGALIDTLSTCANVSVNEIEPADGVGYNQFYVYLNGDVLVDTSVANSIELTQTETKDTLGDIKGMYDLEWSNGQPFNVRNTNLGGRLQSLFELRDGNNGENLSGKMSAIGTSGAGVTQVTITGTNINDVAKLNIPASKGTIMLDGTDYEYDSFDVKVGTDGKFTYTFNMVNSLTTEQKGVLSSAVTSGKTATVGDSVEYKGIPYYMAQLNEFVRTYSQEFNQVHNSGYDLNNKAGVDFFNGTQDTDGDNFIFTEKGSGYDASFSSIPVKDASGNYNASYYNLTCFNFTVNDAVAADPQKLACKSTAGAGKSESTNLKKLEALSDKSTMFAHGAPDSFLQSLTASIGVDSAKAESLSKSQANILKAIDTRRMSVSGVDKDEEGADLVKFQNLLFNQYKVLSVMDEVFDKLINGTAV